MNQNLNYYKVFYTVARYKNISKAADALFISQPAISKTLSKLEENLGCRLFHRTSRGVSLTDEGQFLYERIEKAFQLIDSSEEELQQMNELGIGRIRIGVSTTLCKYILLPYLQNFLQQNPHIQITIRCQSSLQTIELLENGHIDIGLIGISRPSTGIVFSEFCQIQDTFVTTQSYLDLLYGQNHVNDELFRFANLMLLDNENITRQYINDYLYRNHIQTNRILEVSTMDLLIEFAKIGLGIACVIREFVEKELTSRQLIELPLYPQIEPRSVGFAYSKNHIPSRTTMQFLDYLL